MNSREIVVKGIGNAAAIPDIIKLSINIEVNNSDYEKVMSQSSEMLDNLKAAVMSAGHDAKDLKTIRFNIDAKYKKYREQTGQIQRLTGYTCYHYLELEFSLDMQLLGATLGAIADCRAKPRFSIRFSVKDPGIVTERLLENAVENAKRKAEILAKSASVTLGAIQRIDHSWSEHQFYSPTNYLLCENTIPKYAESMALDIVPEEIDLSDTVTVVWAIE